MGKKLRMLSLIKIGGWDVKQGCSDRSLTHHDKKSDVVGCTRVISRNRSSELFTPVAMERLSVKTVMVEMISGQEVE